MLMEQSFRRYMMAPCDIQTVDLKPALEMDIEYIDHRIATFPAEILSHSPRNLKKCC